MTAGWISVLFLAAAVGLTLAHVLVAAPLWPAVLMVAVAQLVTAVSRLVIVASLERTIQHYARRLAGRPE